MYIEASEYFILLVQYCIKTLAQHYLAILTFKKYVKKKTSSTNSKFSCKVMKFSEIVQIEKKF